jgi:hypothetical protein
MSRKIDQCGRCGLRGRRRSMELLRYSGIYACRDCNNKSEGYATLLNYRRRTRDVDIIADYPTVAKLRVNLLHPILLMSAVLADSRFVLVGNMSRFGRIARNKGITCREVDILEDRREVLIQEIDFLSGDNLTVILYPGKYILPAVRRLAERSPHPVILLADGDAAVDCKNEGVLAISGTELPKQRRRDMGAATPAAAPA